MMIKVCIVIGFCLLFWLICYLNTGDDKKNMKGFRSYPKEVQEIVKKDPTLSVLAPKNVKMTTVFVSNVVLFTVVFLIVGVILKYTIGFKGFIDTFLYFVILGQTVNLFDLLVIDLLWWRNTPRIRFSCAPDKELYRNPKVHIYSFARGILMFLVPALVVAGIINILP